MLSFLIIWSILLTVCLLIGLLVLNVFDVKGFSLPGDRFMISVWLGIIILCVCCLAISLILPVSSQVGLLLGCICIILGLLSPKTRQDVYQLLRLLSPQIILKGLLITLAILIFATQQIIWFDTGLYHLGSIHWIAAFGAVPGSGLINSKFGFTSSWFAFSAPLVLNWSSERIGAVSNGYLMLISFFHILIVIEQCRKNIINLANKFIGAFLTIIMLIYIIDNVNGNSLISFSPDISVALLIGIIPWSILLISSNSSFVNETSDINSNLIPLLLAVGAITIKLTAIPLVLIVFLFFLWQHKFKIKPLVTSLVLIVILFIPNVFFAIKTTGCPLYPSQRICFELPWTLKSEVIKDEKKEIIGTNKKANNLHPMIQLMSDRWKWFKSSKKIQLTVLLYLISLVIGTWMLTQKKESNRLQNFLIFLGISGISFIIVVIPLIRFGMGYFLLTPSLFMANLVNQTNRMPLNISSKKYKYIISSGLILMITILLILGRENIENRWLFSEKLPETKLRTEKINNLEYTYPANFSIQCWATELPCSPLPIKQNIKLRDPEKGIAAGFKYIEVE